MKKRIKLVLIVLCVISALVASVCYFLKQREDCNEATAVDQPECQERNSTYENIIHISGFLSLGILMFLLLWLLVVGLWGDSFSNKTNTPPSTIVI